jgi:hypothetical protein
MDWYEFDPAITSWAAGHYGKANMYKLGFFEWEMLTQYFKLL